MNIDQLTKEYEAVLIGFGVPLMSADELYTSLDKKRDSMLVTPRPRIDHEMMQIEALMGYLRSFMVRWDMAEG